MSCKRLRDLLSLVQEPARRGDIENIEIRSAKSADRRITHRQTDVLDELAARVELRDGTAAEERRPIAAIRIHRRAVHRAVDMRRRNKDAPVGDITPLKIEIMGP